MRRIEIEIAETDALRRSRRSRNQIKCRNFQNQVSEFSKFDSSIIQRRWNETVCLFHLNELVVRPAMATDVLIDLQKEAPHLSRHSLPETQERRTITQ